MNYQKHYDAIMSRAKERKLEGYFEKHHILPKCIGGANVKDNLAELTPEEHYVAHQLLVKIYPGNEKLLWAASNMTGRGKNLRRNNKLYGWLRRRLAESRRGKKRDPAIGAKISQSKKGHAPRIGFTHSEETKRKMSEASQGKSKSVEHRQALAAAKLGKKRGKHSEEWTDNQRAAMNTPEYQERFSALMTEKWATRKADPDYAVKRAEQMQRTWETRRQNKKNAEQSTLFSWD